MERNRRQLLAALGSVSAVGLAGCGGTGERDTTSGVSPSPGTESRAETTPAVSPPTAQAQRLVVEDRDWGGFGRDVALTGDGTTSVIAGDRSVFVFAAVDGSWRRQARITAPGNPGVLPTNPGTSLDISDDGTTILVGDLERTDTGYDGSASVYTLSDGEWTAETTFAVDTDARTGGFGRAAALSGDGKTAVVGAPFDGEGSVSVFSRSDGEWTEEARVGHPENALSFGLAVAVGNNGETALVGSDGAAHVFSRSGGSWRREAELAPERLTSLSFGSAVSLSADGTRALVGADQRNAGGDSYIEGGAFVFETSGDAWSRVATMSADGEGRGLAGFGDAVALAGSGRAAVVGADTQETVYVYTESNDEWDLATTFTADFTFLGSSVAVTDDGGTAIVGAPAGGPAELGAAYVYD